MNLKARTWGGRRVRVLNDGRANSFRRFIIEKFGDAALRSGGGVLDIAGGKGELSFLFENLNGISSTCIEPRPLQLRSFVRRFTFGRNDCCYEDKLTDYVELYLFRDVPQEHTISEACHAVVRGRNAGDSARANVSFRGNRGGVEDGRFQAGLVGWKQY